MYEFFEFELEMHYHPENFDGEVRFEDYEDAENIHTACVELQEVEAKEAEINYNFI